MPLDKMSQKDISKGFETIPVRIRTKIFEICAANLRNVLLEASLDGQRLDYMMYQPLLRIGHVLVVNIFMTEIFVIATTLESVDGLMQLMAPPSTLDDLD